MRPSWTHGAHRRRGLAAVGAILALVPAGVVIGRGAHAAIACTATDPSGGSWPSYGHDLSNTRTQDQECGIGPSTVASLKKVWAFSTAPSGGGVIDSTPTVADGRVFTGTGTGQVFALSATTGATLWSAQVVPPSTRSGVLGGLIVGAPAVDSAARLVVVALNVSGGPFVVALREGDGKVAWTSKPLDSLRNGPWGVNAAENASPVIWNGLVLVGFYGSEYTPDGRGGFAVLDEHGGAILAHTYTISDADYAMGYRGASVWASAVIDPATGFAYVGTGNPGGHPNCGTDAACQAHFPQCAGTLPGQPCQAAIEDPISNSIIKIDLNRTSPSFGQIVAHYKGNPDTYVSGIDRQPACANAGNAEYGVGGGTDGAWSVACAQLDLDFGASPNLFGPPGARTVGELQKAGVYHAVNTADMSGAWKTVVGGPCFVCNGGSTAVDSTAVYGASSPGGNAFSLSQDGGPRWVTPIGDGTHFESTSLANGVAYTVDNAGFLDAFDSGTGVPLLRRPLFADVGQPVADVSSAGVSIAQHTVFVAISDFVVAYQL